MPILATLDESQKTRGAEGAATGGGSGLEGGVVGLLGEGETDRVEVGAGDAGAGGAMLGTLLDLDDMPGFGKASGGGNGGGVVLKA